MDYCDRFRVFDTNYDIWFGQTGLGEERSHIGLIKDMAAAAMIKSIIPIL